VVSGGGGVLVLGFCCGGGVGGGGEFRASTISGRDLVSFCGLAI